MTGDGWIVPGLASKAFDKFRADFPLTLSARGGSAFGGNPLPQRGRGEGVGTRYEFVKRPISVGIGREGVTP